jgi:hypothetical protein
MTPACSLIIPANPIKINPRRKFIEFDVLQINLSRLGSSITNPLGYRNQILALAIPAH